jgi:hypothetical protein
MPRIVYKMGLTLAVAFLLSSALVSGFPQAGLAYVCCEKESQGEASDNTGCPGPDCLCISCISLVAVPTLQIDNASFMESAPSSRAQLVHTSGHFRTIEHPPKNC